MPRSDKTWIFPIGNKDTEIFQENHKDTILNFLRDNNCKFRNCCDVGAHIGIWSTDFVKQFKWVYAFEPIEELRNCYQKNVTQSNYTLYPFGLGSSEMEIQFQYDPEEGGNTQIDPLGNYTGKIRRLDDLNLQDIDYIKMDAEGYELEILKGATDLLTNQSPIIHLEMKLQRLSQFNLTKHDVRNWLSRFNYKQHLKIVNEFVFVKDASTR